MPNTAPASSDPYYEGPRSTILREALAHLGLDLKISRDGRAWTRPEERTIFVPPGLMFPDMHWTVAKACESMCFGLTSEPPPDGVVIPLHRRR